MKKDFYFRDLAYVHDAGFDIHAKAASKYLIALLKKTGRAGGRIYDLGCGSGISSRVLSEAGFKIVGVDISAPMLALAKHRAPGAEFIKCPVYETPLSDCVAVTGVGEVFSYTRHCGEYELE